eukprot:7381935-Prymnesium_polylepis.1
MDTSEYGIIGTAVGTKAPPPTASSHDTTIGTPILGDDGCEQYEELQVGTVNELILCARTDKA